MPDPPSRAVTRMLNAADGGAAVDMEALLPLVYDQLRAIAVRRMEGERVDHTLQATALVNEAYLRLVGEERVAWNSRRHFYFAAAEAMQRILVEHARGRGRLKRGGDRKRVPLDVLDLATAGEIEQIVSLEDAVRRLGEQDERMGAIVRLRFYAGLSEQETADALGVSERTVQRNWVFARAWLQRQLNEQEE